MVPHPLLYISSKDPELVKKKQFLVENRNKIKKFGFFDNFSRISEYIPWIFSVLRASTTIFKIHAKIFGSKIAIIFLLLVIGSINLRAGDF